MQSQLCFDGSTSSQLSSSALADCDRGTTATKASAPIYRHQTRELPHQEYEARHLQSCAHACRGKGEQAPAALISPPFDCKKLGKCGQNLGGGDTSVEVMPAAAPAARRRGSVSCVPLGPLPSSRLYTSYEHSWHAEYGSTLSTWGPRRHAVAAAVRRRTQDAAVCSAPNIRH